MFIFDRCCRSSAAVTPVKYECDTNNLTGTFAISKILLTEKFMNGALVTPTPDTPGQIPAWQTLISNHLPRFWRFAVIRQIVIFQIWRSSRHSRLPHRRAHYSTEQVHPDRPVWDQRSKLLPCTYSQLRLSVFSYISFYPSALRAGGVLSSRSGRAGGWAGGCQTCGTHISVTAWGIFSIRSSVELSRPVGVHCHSHMPICPIWACPWAKNLSNLPQIGSRLCGTHISETAGWIYPI